MYEMLFKTNIWLLAEITDVGEAGFGSATLFSDQQ